MNTKISKERTPLPILSVIILASLLIILGGFHFYKYQENKIINEKQNELAVIATLKVKEIEKWRMEHIRDGEILRSIIPRNPLIFSFLNNEEPSESRNELLERIKIFISNYDYHSLLLVDDTGRVRLVYPPVDKPPILNKAQLHDLQNTEISFSDLHFSNDLPGRIHIDLQIPLNTIKENKLVRFATLLLRIDPEKTLYPLIQLWPTPSKSSETLLIRKEGDSVLFLNELRHKHNTALNFKLPLKKNLPAAAAISGHEGVFEGIDYRGIAVISYVMKISDTSWYMVAKVDKKEIYSPLNQLIILVSIGSFLLIFTIGSTITYFWRNQHIRYLNELNVTKDKFFSIVSHDLRSPFVSLYGLANLMVEDLDKKNLSKIRQYALLIQNSTQNGINLVRNLTEWSKINTNKLKFNPHELDIVPIINEVTELMRAHAIQKSITLTKETPSHFKIHADKEMLSTVLRNLISNSIKFTNPGGRVHISLTEKENKAKIKVIDSGIGMRKETIEKLFRLGENISTPGTQNEQGTGLGLILVKEFISLHQGEIHVLSE
ncbi:MAG: ATP-binding protein, partial [Methanococcaceae archaeon]